VVRVFVEKSGIAQQGLTTIALHRQDVETYLALCADRYHPPKAGSG